MSGARNAQSEPCKLGAKAEGPSWQCSSPRRPRAALDAIVEVDEPDKGGPRGATVRDILFGEPNSDVNVVVEGDVIALAHAVPRSLTTYPRAEKFGTAGVLYSDDERLDS